MSLYVKKEFRERATIAEALGFERRREVHFPHRTVWWKVDRHYCDIDLPEFEIDQSTRPQMLSAMDWHEKAAACRMAIQLAEPRDGAMLVNSDLVFVLELDQPTFAKLFLQVKNLTPK